MFSKLNYLNNTLFFDSINLNKIGENYKTPIFVYSRDKIVENFRNYEDNFKNYGLNNYQISYAVKANENLTILKLIKELGGGADTVSGAEIEKAIIVGIETSKIVFSGVSKSDRELEYAINNSVGQINIESFEEFLVITEIAKKLNKVANISIRINPNIDAETHEKITTGKRENKFGVDINKAEKIIEISKGNKLLNFKGLSVHIGSQILKLEKFKLTFEYLKKIYEKHPEFTTIDLGGGLGIQYREEEKLPSYSEFVSLIKEILGDLNVKIILEPDRSIVGDAGILLTKVINTKKTDKKNFIMLDAGFNQLIRPAMYDAFHFPMLVNKKTENKLIYDIVGPICESGDVFLKDYTFYETERNNYIVFLCAGAYGRSMSSIYNLHDIAGELLVENGKVRVIRKEINFKELLRFEEVY